MRFDFALQTMDDDLARFSAPNTEVAEVRPTGVWLHLAGPVLNVCRDVRSRSRGFIPVFIADSKWQDLLLGDVQRVTVPGVGQCWLGLELMVMEMARG